MKVILLKNIPTCGREGETVEVSDGYARNFLFPQNLAVQATARTLFVAKTKKEKQEKETEKSLKETGRLAAALDGLEIVVLVKTNKVGKLYAAVSAKDIVGAIRAKGIKVDPDWVKFSGPIKEIGVFEVQFNLPHGFEAKINVQIESK